MIVPDSARVTPPPRGHLVAWDQLALTPKPVHTTQPTRRLGPCRVELDEAKRREMYYEMQAIVSQDGGVVIPMFASYVFATQTNVETGDQIGSNWDMDGERWMERWWFS